MKYKVKFFTGKKVSFDFDGTLSDDFDGTLNPQKSEIRDILTQVREMGNDVFIVTKRYSPKNKSKGIINEHIDVLKLASELKVPGDKVFFTNRELKGEKLSHLDVDMHFENSEPECQQINSLNKKIKTILITDPYWRDLIY